MMHLRRLFMLMFLGFGTATCWLGTTTTTTPCSSSFDCEHKLCQSEECNAEGYCEYTAAVAGYIGGDYQTAGDCKHAICSSGSVANENDNTDVPDDSNPCTVDSCVDGAPMHQPAQDGTTCVISGKQGSCIAGACSP